MKYPDELKEEITNIVSDKQSELTDSLRTYMDHTDGITITGAAIFVSYKIDGYSDVFANFQTLTSSVSPNNERFPREYEELLSMIYNASIELLHRHRGKYEET